MTADLELRGLVKQYGSSRVVDGVELGVEPGELIALLGPSGCGKTTTLRMIAGFVRPDAGRIWLRGRDITDLPPNRRDAGMVFQSYALFPHMTVRRNIEFGLRSRRVPRNEITTRVAQALSLVGLSAFDARYPRELSGGQQQRVAVARVLALNPQLLLLDEPLSNLDAKLRVQMRQEIRRLQKEVGITTLFVTHDQDEALTMADRVVVMNHGRIEQVGTPLEIYDRPRTRFVADFIGQSNFIEGQLAANDGKLRFVARSGLYVEVAGDGLIDGSGVLAVRPEKIEISPPDAPGAQPGTVQQITRLGSVLHYGVALDSGDIMIVQEQRRPGRNEYNIGTRVGLRWCAEDGHFLPGAPPQADGRDRQMGE